ncbi:hypothetical protein Slin15195_G025500 [Septoria linicola]|uniref:Uncharacterized protein n=1 Tax=Septoria linicola TaxID=215465 RepID=A0A9Q9EEX2_9PEZI|nr:hypothetical protein Slin15195_G025500 [Septoria linicola]
MLSSLLVGVALAIGHHAFYASLAGTAVSSDPIKVVGWTTTQQQINIAVGTAFAFVVKASLILACSTAYMQLLFGVINRQSFKLSQLDNWFGGLSDFWSLMCIGTYWRYPLLTLVALTCWLLPIAAIISPASLSVVFDQISPSPVRNAFVPLPAFDSLAFSKFAIGAIEGGQRITYTGPSVEVSRIALASAAQGVILPIEPPATNTTWQTSISIPRLACEDIGPQVQKDMKDNLIDYFNNVTNTSDWPRWSTMMLNYISWTAYSDDTWPMPFKQDINSGWEIQQLATGKQPYSSGIGIDIFFAIFPHAALDRPWQQHGLKLEFSDYNDPSNATKIASDKRVLIDWLWQDSTMLHCRIVPTDLTIEFNYSGLDQTQQIRVLEMKESKEPDYNSTAVQANGPNDTFVSEDLSTATVLVGGGGKGAGGPVAATQFSSTKTVVGGAVAATRSSSRPIRISTSTASPSITARSSIPDRPLRLKSVSEMDFDASNITSLARHALKLSSWAAIQEAAMALWLGASNSYASKPGWASIPSGYGGVIGNIAFSTQVFATVMQDSKELSRLGRTAPTAENITNVSSGLAYDQAASLLANTSTTQSNRLFRDMIQEMFLNITLSMASSKDLVYQESSLLAPAKVQVVQHLYGNVYSYASDKLWLAYGIAIGVCVLNLVIGMLSVVRTRASFTDNFSTIVRVARNASIEADMHEDSLPGKDPLPKRIGNAGLYVRKAESPSDTKHLGLVTITETHASSDGER